MSESLLKVRALAYRLVVTMMRILVHPRRPVFYRIAILKLDKIGDSVLSLGAVRKLLAVFGEDEAILIVSSAAAPLYRMEFPAAKLLLMPAFCERFWPDFVTRILGYASSLRAIKVEHLICLRHQHSDYLHAIAMMINARRCHASRWEGNKEHVSLSFPRCLMSSYPVKSPEACLELEAHRRVVESVLAARVEIDEMMPKLMHVKVVDGDSLLVCPVAGDAIRQYPADLLAESIQVFLKQWPNTAVQFCLPPGSDQKHWGMALENKGIFGVEWLHPKDLESLINLIARARIVLAPDSGPSHIATTLDKPGVFILGGGHFGMFAPWSKSGRQTWLNHAMDCYQCRWICTQPEPYCITHIAPADIARSLSEVMVSEAP